MKRLIIPHLSEDKTTFDIPKIREELAHYKPQDINGEGLVRTFNVFLRQVEQNIVTKLANELNDDEHKDWQNMANLVDNLDVKKPIQDSAPLLDIQVGPRAKDNKIVLTGFDALREQVQVNLLLRPDKEGRLIHAETNSVWQKSTNGHFVCIGVKDGNRILPIPPEIVQFCKQKGHPYDVSKIAP